MTGTMGPSLLSEEMEEASSLQGKQALLIRMKSNQTLAVLSKSYPWEDSIYPTSFPTFMMEVKDSSWLRQLEDAMMEANPFPSYLLLRMIDQVNQNLLHMLLVSSIRCSDKSRWFAYLTVTGGGLYLSWHWTKGGNRSPDLNNEHRPPEYWLMKDTLQFALFNIICWVSFWIASSHEEASFLPF